MRITYSPSSAASALIFSLPRSARLSRRVDEARGEHRKCQAALARSARAEKPLNAEPAHRAEHRRYVSVRKASAGW